MQEDAELQHDLNTDEISRHFKKRVKKSEPLDDEAKATTKEDSQDEDNEEVENQNNKDKEEFESNNVTDDQNDVQVEDDEDEESTDPKILITTTELKISLRTYKLCRELSRVLPNAQYFYRKNVRLSKVIPEAIKRGYSAIMVINENRREPSNILNHLKTVKLYK